MSDADIEPVSLPRTQAGPRPQHLVVTLFGDYWLSRGEHLPSGALVALTNEFGISSTSARAALGRLARRGLFSSSKSGRRTFYGLTEHTRRVIEEGRRRILAFGHAPMKEWDGSWLVVIFSVPEEQREARHLLRARLRWLGFGPLYDGVWVSPWAMIDDATAALKDCGVDQATVLRSEVAHPSLGDLGHPLHAWNLVDLRAKYDEFIASFKTLRTRALHGQVSASEALVERTEIMDTWRQFPSLDPDLPVDLLPRSWPRADAYELFAEVYDALGPLAEVRFRQILSGYAPELAPLVSHFTSQAALGAAGC